MYQLSQALVEDGSVNTEFEPVTAEELQRIEGYADSVVAAFKGELPGFGYNPLSIKLLSDSITSGRADHSEDQRVRVANLFGAFCGQARLSFNKGVSSRWIRSKGDLGIVFTRGKQQWVVFPINRLFKHIDSGPEYSTYDSFMAVHELLRPQTA